MPKNLKIAIGGWQRHRDMLNRRSTLIFFEYKDYQRFRRKG